MSKQIDLTSFSRFAGCGAKLGPSVLDKALCQLSQPDYPNLITDFHGSEDAGVYKLREDLAIVQTIDFFPPIVDDPLIFGEIAAANALSDIYAMGATPITAVSVLCYPDETLDMKWLRLIMEGGLNKLIEAETALLGGHSVKDPELKFGFSVNGTIHPNKVLKNSEPRPGDLLVLTKALGTGVINTAHKAEMGDPIASEEASQSMRRLNKTASQLIQNLAVSSCTDVTGFGLYGHAAEMLQSKNCDFHFFEKEFPLFKGVKEYIDMGLVPAGTYNNRQFREHTIQNRESLSPETLDLVFDPQTSGGLLLSLPPNAARDLVKELIERDHRAAIIGEVSKGKGEIIHHE